MPQAVKSTDKPLFEGPGWDFDTMRRCYDAIEEVALEDLGLDVYANQIEMISSEQMLDAYSSIGMPLMYRHWSFGKHFVRNEALYRQGFQGLAYEIVINSNPCISYYMEDNSMTMQALVMAHAAFGHNHFFKNNELFKQWTDAEGILAYLEYAKGFVAKCEDRHGPAEVESVLDAAHALMDHGAFRYRRPPKLSLAQERDRERQRREHEERMVNVLWRTLPEDRKPARDEAETKSSERKRELHLPEENLLYFIERYSPVLADWRRELLNIVRNIAQYFYPQKQTKVMNEGCACFVHFHILGALHKKGLLTDGAMMEVLHMHANVLTQPDFDDPRYRGVNPYALGFAMMRDICRICSEPTAEDRDWFPEIAGCGDWRGVLREAWANYRDESFIRQFLSPKLMRDFRMFALNDDARQPYLNVTAIHDERGYRAVRDALARSYDISTIEPDIQVVDVDLMGERRLHLAHNRWDGIPLDADARDRVMAHLRYLWGYEVTLES